MLPKVSQQKYFYYNCGRSHAIGQLACSSHYINRDTFHQAVLEDIRRNAKLFSEDAEKAAQRLMELKCADQQKQTATMKRDLASAKKRLADLDVKLKRTYEDNMSGKLPDHIFTMFIADYDQERAALKANIAEMEKALEKVRDSPFGTAPERGGSYRAWPPHRQNRRQHCKWRIAHQGFP